VPAWFGSLAPDNELDRESVVEIAQQYVAENPVDVTARNALGAALLRAGRYPAAIRELQMAATLALADEEPQSAPPVYAWLLMAIAHGKAGNSTEAHQRFEQARTWAAANAESPRMSTWLRKLTVQLLTNQFQQMSRQVALVTD
jgi:Flp pilus assembly protein TadD